MNRNELVRRSAELIPQYRKLRDLKLSLVPDPKLQQEIEDVYLHLKACTETGGPPGRKQELTAKLTSLKSQREQATKLHDAELGAAEDAIRDINDPYIKYTERWLREVLRMRPEVAFGQYVQDAIREIDRMRLRPLEDVFAVMEKHKRAVERWPFEGRGEKPYLPSLSFESI